MTEKHYIPYVYVVDPNLRHRRPVKTAVGPVGGVRTKEEAMEELRVWRKYAPEAPGIKYEIVEIATRLVGEGTI